MESRRECVFDAHSELVSTMFSDSSLCCDTLSIVFFFCDSSVLGTAECRGGAWVKCALLNCKCNVFCQPVMCCDMPSTYALEDDSCLLGIMEEDQEDVCTMHAVQW